MFTVMLNDVPSGAIMLGVRPRPRAGITFFKENYR